MVFQYIQGLIECTLEVPSVSSRGIISSTVSGVLLIQGTFIIEVKQLRSLPAPQKSPEPPPSRLPPPGLAMWKAKALHSSPVATFSNNASMMSVPILG